MTSSYDRLVCRIRIPSPRITIKNEKNGLKTPFKGLKWYQGTQDLRPRYWTKGNSLRCA